MSATGETRASTKPKALVRGEPVVRRVLEAVIHELGRAGYAALRIEDVAARAKINKSSVYRRWPTKEALVRAALLSIVDGDESPMMPDTGSVREDLLFVARRVIALWGSPRGRVLVEILSAEPPSSELSIIARSIQETHAILPRQILERARDRGELTPEADPALIFDVLRAACRDTIWRHQAIAEGFVARVVDALLLGALSTRGRRALKR